jgi:hypothetical protein
VKPFRYSSLTDYHKCPKYFELKHLLGLDDGSGRSGEMRFGSALHLGIQDLFEGGDGVDVFNVFWDLQKNEKLEYSYYNRLSHADHMKLGLSLLEIFRDEHLKKFKREHIEKTMVGKAGEHSFRGTADFIGVFKDKRSIVDWKTSGQPYDQYKLIYNEQLYGYAELFRQETGEMLEQAVYGVAVKDPKNPRWQFKVNTITRQKLDNVLDNIALVCEDISSRTRFHRNPNQCVIGKRICPFFKKCHSSQEGDVGQGKEEEST